MKRVVLLVLFAAFVAVPLAAHAQASPAPAGDAASKVLKSSFDRISSLLVASAERMPEENFAFKATPDVRSFGAIVAHVANSHYGYCARIKGEKNPAAADFEKLTAKADILKALNESIAYCAPLYSGLTDAGALEPAPAPPAAAAPQGQAPKAAQPPAPPRPKLQMLLGNVTHDWEHYGNLVTYLRLKGLVPPSSDPRPPAR